MTEPRIVPRIPITLDKPRTLLYDKKAVKLAELTLTKAWGQPYSFYRAMRLLSAFGLEAYDAGDISKLSYIDLTIVVWAGCLHEDPQVPLEQIEDAVDPTDIRQLLELVVSVIQAWNATSPQASVASGEATAESDPLDGSTGSSSGLLSVGSSG